ncbi:hypothetical protein ABZ896_42275 [Streptomyces sp. NPDC047072]|uniref:hypothetical protein n=1 Tax=Streptomyces sp. NPDC047072 TaxID=3154809 RepID=UPI0033DDA8BF
MGSGHSARAAAPAVRRDPLRHGLTYSGHRALDADRRAGLLADIRELIEDGFGGRITKRYLHELIVTTRSEA